MKSGATYLLPVILDVDVSQVDSINFDMKAKSIVTKVFPESVTYSGGVFMIPLSQEDTETLGGSMVIMEAQINYSDKTVRKSTLHQFSISNSVNTKLVEGSAPSAYPLQDVNMKVLGEVLIAMVDPEEVQQEINKVDEQMQHMLAGYVSQLDQKYANDIGDIREAMGNTLLSVENGHLTFTT